MQEDHITALAEAIDNDDKEAAKRHLLGLAHQVLNLMNRAVDALEAAAAK